MAGTIFVFKPSLFYYTKCIYLIKNYEKIFGKLYFEKGIGEILTYYTIFDDWSSNKIDRIYRCQDKAVWKKKKKDCIIIYYEIIKPFKKPLIRMFG